MGMQVHRPKKSVMRKMAVQMAGPSDGPNGLSTPGMSFNRPRHRTGRPAVMAANPFEAPASIEELPRICGAPTKKHTDCLRPPSPGSDRCKIHAGQVVE